MMKKGLINPVLAAVFAAFSAILSQIAIPTPFGIPFTLQTFAVALYGFILGPLWATVTVAVYLMLGLVGLPVFSGFGGGIGALLGPTGGFLWGFLILALFCGAGQKSKNFFIKITFSITGLLICHLCGILLFSYLYKVTLISSAVTVSLPYILKDILCILAALAIAPKINRVLKAIFSYK